VYVVGVRCVLQQLHRTGRGGCCFVVAVVRVVVVDCGVDIVAFRASLRRRAQSGTAQIQVKPRGSVPFRNIETFANTQKGNQKLQQQSTTNSTHYQTMSRSDILGGAAVPLTDALPWSPSQCPRTFLITDSIGTDGRFLLYTLASQAHGRILWLAGGPITTLQIQQGLKKIGGTKAAVTVRSLVAELAQQPDEWDEPRFIQQHVYPSILEWLDSGNNATDTPTWIILEDVSTLAHLLGERLIFHLLLALNAKSHDHNQPFGLMIRCSNDRETESFPTFVGTSVGQPQDCFGASSSSSSLGPISNAIPWERSLVELADAVLDVLPLTSGYTRELQGRMVLTPLPWGRGWRDRDEPSTQPKQSYPATQIINYGITDQKIMAYIM
jgi:hypothetical protein